MTDDGVRSLARRYSEDAEAYRRHWASLMLPLGRGLVDGVSLARPRRVLDLGAGVGLLLPEMAARWPEALVVGADRAPGMLALAPPRFPRVLADARALPFRDGAFDVVTMAFMLFHVPTPADGLREVRRVIGPGGEVGVATWGEQPPFPAQEAWDEELDREGASAAPTPDFHDRTNTREKVASLLRDASFTDVRVRELPVDDVVDLEGFVDRRLTVGSCRKRFESIPVDRRDAFLARARARLDRLPPDAFVDRMPAILAWATPSEPSRA